MTKEIRASIIDKLLRNVLFSGFIFMVWAEFMPWKMYFLFGLVVALILVVGQIKQLTNKYWYGVIFVSDLIFWPTMMFVNIRNAFKENVGTN